MLKRQGDILLEKIGEIPVRMPATLRRDVVESGVIAEGEVTGHAHVLKNGTLYTQAGRMYAVAEVGGGTVVHDEHDTLELEEGVWLVHRQTEYADENERIQVLD